MLSITNNVFCNYRIITTVLFYLKYINKRTAVSIIYNTLHSGCGIIS